MQNQTTRFCKLNPNDYICEIDSEKRRIMNRLYRYLVLAAGALLCWSCGDKADPTPLVPPATDATTADLAGEWQLTAWSGDTQSPGEIYLRLDEAGTFTLYQNINAHGFRQYEGSFEFDSATAVIRGTYADGTAWGSAYIVGALTANTMQWQAVGTNDISTYTRTQIPDLTIDPTSRAEAEPAERPFL